MPRGYRKVRHSPDGTWHGIVTSGTQQGERTGTGDDEAVLKLLSPRREARPTQLSSSIVEQHAIPIARGVQT